MQQQFANDYVYGNDSIDIKCFVQLPWRDTNLESNVEFAMSIVKTIRSIRQEYQGIKGKPEGKKMLSSYSHFYSGQSLFFSL